MDEPVSLNDYRWDHIVATTSPVATLTVSIHIEEPITPILQGLVDTGGDTAVSFQTYPSCTLWVDKESIPQLLALEALRDWADRALKVWEKQASDAADSAAGQVE